MTDNFNTQLARINLALLLMTVDFSLPLKILLSVIEAWEKIGFTFGSIRLPRYFVLLKIVLVE